MCDGLMLMWTKTALAALFAVASVVSGSASGHSESHVKFLLSKSTTEEIMSAINSAGGVAEPSARATRGLPCISVSAVSKGSLSFNVTLAEGREPPWNRSSAIVYQSNTVQDVVAVVRNSPVPGLGLSSFGNVFDAFLSGGCLTYIKGGIIRDSLLNLSAADVDITVSCSVDVLVGILKERGWTYSVNSYVAHIGDAASIDQIDAISGTTERDRLRILHPLSTLPILCSMTSTEARSSLIPQGRVCLTSVTA